MSMYGCFLWNFTFYVFSFFKISRLVRHSTWFSPEPLLKWVHFLSIRFAKGKPGRGTGYDLDEEDILYMEQCNGIAVVSAIFGTPQL